MKTSPNKFNGVKHAIVRGPLPYVKVVYIKAIERNSITWGSTGLVHWRMCELAWLVVTRIEFANLLDISAH